MRTRTIKAIMKNRLSMPQILLVVAGCVAGRAVVTTFPHFGQTSLFGSRTVPQFLQNSVSGKSYTIKSSLFFADNSVSLRTGCNKVELDGYCRN
jgi:hypothetical protein